jgi:hypothetical protein
MPPLDRLAARSPVATRFEIDRVEATIAPEQFVTRYYLPQTPVIVTGVARDWPAVSRWSPEYLRAALERSAVEKAYNFDVPADHPLVRDCRVPPLVDYIARNRPVSTRAESVRVWISRRGTRTRWHYDGNSLQVFNVQVRGRKRWSLISPDTPLPTMGFGQGARTAYVDVADLRMPIVFTVCEAEAGDLLFVPQHWYHAVESLADDNLNINWVWTDRALLMASDTRTAVREREHMVTLHRLGTWLQRLGYSPAFLPYVETYGGAPDFAVARELGQSVSTAAVARRLLLELWYSAAGARHRRLNQARELQLNDGVRRSALDYFLKPAPHTRTGDPDR